MALLTFINPATKYKWVNLTWIIALLTFPVILWILPSFFFDDTGFELCPSKLFFNVECFGCGMTRAVMHSHHWEWNEAFYYNYGVVVVYPALVIIWALWFYKAIKRHQKFGQKKAASSGN
jgi:hypothetical protein